MSNANDTNFQAGRYTVVFTGDVNSGDSADKDLFRLPANCVIVDGRILGHYSAASNATSALLYVGISPSSGGLGTEYLNGYSLVGSQGSNFQSNIPWQRFGSQASNTWTSNAANKWAVGSNSFLVSGKVTGSPGAGSGPWTIVFEVIP